MEKKIEKKAKQEKKIAQTSCKDRDCPIHGNLKTRGKIFEGRVISKLNRRIAIEFERMIYVKKYERYTKKKTKIHARLPDCMKEKIQLGDLVKIQECRPLSKIIHFAVINKIKGMEEK